MIRFTNPSDLVAVDYALPNYWLQKLSFWFWLLAFIRFGATLKRRYRYLDNGFALDCQPASRAAERKLV